MCHKSCMNGVLVKPCTIIKVSVPTYTFFQSIVLYMIAKAKDMHHFSFTNATYKVF